MNEALILLDITIVLLLAKVLEEVMARIKQPTILGDLLAGIIVGPTVFGLVSSVKNIESFAWVGIVILLFLGGVESSISEFKRYGMQVLVVALGGVLACFLLGFSYAYMLGYDLKTMLFLGAILTPTSVGVTLRTLMDLNPLHTKEGRVILGAAVADDIYSVIALALVYSLAMENKVTLESLSPILIGLATIMTLTFLINKFSHEISIMLRKLKVHESAFTTMLIMGLAAATLTAFFRLSPLVGAFFIGLALSSIPGVELLRERLEFLSMIITPIFFVYAGILLNPWEVVSNNNLYEILCIGLSIAALGVIGKIIGCGLAAKLSGMNWNESLAVGLGMMPRAGVDLVIAVIGLSIGAITQELYFGALLLIYFSSLTTPVLLKRAFKYRIHKS